MRISELASAAGVPLATVKYYLREGLLMPGEATSATQAQYDDTHVRRLGLVRALSAQGLPLHKIKTVIDLVDHPGDDLFAALSSAVAALPPYVDTARADHPRARRVLEQLDQLYDPDSTAVAQLEQALEALDAAGLQMTERRIEAYGRHIGAIAELDLELLLARSRETAVETAVLGTALYEPVLTAMRRLAHQHLAARAFGVGDRPEPGASPDPPNSQEQQ